MADNSALPRRPSQDLAVLEQQLLQALARLEEPGSDAEEPELYRAYLRHAQALCWQGVAQRRPGTPREVLDHLQAVQPFIDAHLPALGDPCEEAAFALYFSLDFLYVADRAMGEAKAETRLANRDLSLTEREVLRVLLTNRDRYLRRGEVQRMLNLLRRPTPARIGQILANLDHEDLVVRMQGRAQGNPDASFYALSPPGLEICRRLGLDRRRVPYFRLEEAGWAAYLAPERIAAREEVAVKPGRVTAVWSYRGGPGITTAVAHAAPLVADRMVTAGNGRLLVLDLDLESPSLDAHLAPEGLGECRGLRGLIADFYKVPLGERSKWLCEALLAPGYVLQPNPGEQPNLYYLPSGFGPESLPGLDEECAEAQARLHTEAGRRSGVAEVATGETGSTFLFELRGVLWNGDLYSRTLMVPHAGLGLTAWAAVLELANELVLCAPLSDRDAHPMRAVLGNFLHRFAEDGRENLPSVGFLLTSARRGDEGDLDAWVEKDILRTVPSGGAAGRYRAVALSEGEQVDWVGLLEGGSEERLFRSRERRLIRRSIDEGLNPDRLLQDQHTARGLFSGISNSVVEETLVILMERAGSSPDKQSLARINDMAQLLLGNLLVAQGLTRSQSAGRARGRGL